MEFLNTLYYGNTLLQWFAALALMVVAFIAGRVVYWFIRRTIKGLARRTKTMLDDVIVDLVEEPLVAAIVLIGIRVALGTLTLPADIQKELNNAFTFFLVLLLTWLVVRLYDAFHQAILVPTVAKTSTDLDDQILPMLRTGVKFIVISLGVVVALNNAGYDVGAILAGLGVIGLALALAAQDTVSNVFGGITIILHRPFKINDRIIVGNIEGYIREVGLRSATIQKASGERILIPNKMFVSEPVTNIQTADWYFDQQHFHLHRDTTCAQLEALLLAMQRLAESNPIVPWAQTVVAKIGEYSIDVDLLYGVQAVQVGDRYTTPSEKMSVVQSQLNLACLDLFRREGLKLALPFLVYTDRAELANDGVFRP